MKHTPRFSVIVSAIVALATLLGANPAAAAARTASVSGNWSSTTTWGGQPVPVAGDTVTINTGVTVTVDTNNAACTSVAIGTAGGTATLTFAASGSPSLTVSGSVTVGNSGNVNRVGVITFTSGSTLICGSLTHGTTGTQASSINMTAGGTLQVNGAITVSSSGATFTPGVGTVILTANDTLPSTAFSSFNNLVINSGTIILGVNVSIVGNLTVNGGTLDLATFTANRSAAGGTLTIADGATMLIGGAANFPLNFTTYALGANSTVTYDNTGAQTVSPRSYGNLTFAGSGAKSITNASTSVAGTLSIAPTGSATANISAGVTNNVGSLTLGGLGRAAGFWGGNTSGGNFTNTTYFAATTGKLNVANDTRIAPTVTTWPTASAITYGQALSSSTLSGGSAPAGSFAFTAPTTIPTTTGVYAAQVVYSPTDTTTYDTTVTNNVNVTVNPKALTVTGITAANKVYDRLTSATVDASLAVLNGLVGSDDVSLNTGSVTGTFANNTVANGKTVTIAGLTLSGADAAKYTVTQPTTTANITARSLTVSGGSVTSKTYNGNTTATISTAGMALVGLISPDSATLNTGSATGTYDNKNVGTNKPVQISGLTISGGQSANYSLTQPTNSGNITVRSLAVTATGVNKVYDGTTNATVTLTDNRISGDVFTANYAVASFTSAAAGTGKTVNVSGISLAGTDAANYTPNTTETTTANITGRPVQVSGGRVYNGTTQIASSDLSIANSVDEANVSLTGTGILTARHAGTQSVSGGGIASRVQSTTGSANNATSISMTALGSAPVNGNTLIAVISTRGTAQNQVSGITQTGATWTRVVQSGASAATTSTTEIWYAPNITNAGTAITINLAASLRAAAVVMEYDGLLSVSSVDATNSNFANGTASTAATTGTTPTTAQANELWIGGIAFTNSGYTLGSIQNSFTSVANVASGSGTAGNNTRLYALERIVTATGTAASGGTISTASLWSGAMATFRSELTSGSALALTGAAAGNYTVAGLTGSATITAKALNPTGLAADNKPYDGNTTATLSGSAELSAPQAPGAGSTADGIPYTGDTVSISGTASGSFADKNVGNAKAVTVTGLTLAGAQAGNYSLTAPILAANITATPLTGIITVDNKAYDGNVTATITARSLGGVIGADDVSLTGGTATFASKSVGTGKIVTATGMTLSGLDAGNYSAPISASTTADISARPLTVSAAAQNKAYDGTTTATVLFSDDRIAGDVLTASAASADFDTKDVGAVKPVSVLGIDIGGLDAGNYALANTTAASSADITAAPLTGHITANNKIYDGDNSAVIATRTLTGVISADDVTLIGGTATFDNKNVGTGKTVTATGLSLGGADLANYSLASSSATATANITALALTGSVTLTNKIYDGTTNALIVERAVAGVLGAEDVSLTGGVASYDDKNVGTNKNVTITDLALAGADAANYSLTSSTLSGVADITECVLNVAAIGVNKTYDATTTATVTLSDDRIAGDALTTAYTAAAFADALVGTGKAVTVSGITVGGADSVNYQLANTETNTIADIAAALLTPSITADNKAYDGNVSATIATRSVTGVIGAEDVSLVGGAATFADKNVGLGKLVGVTGLSLGGADADNYQLATTSASTTADIAPALLGAGVTVANKVYDGTVAATIVTRSLSGVVAPDDVALSGGVASFADKQAGLGKSVAVTGLMLGGADQSNYTLISGDVNTTADITARALTVSAAAQNKVYDGNPDATVALSDDRINGDVLTVSHTAASFDTKNVGTAKPVSVSGISITGADADNYALANTTTSSSADITAAALTASATVANKVYDGTTAAAIASRTLTGVVGSDDVTLTGGTASFADKHVGEAKPVAVTGLTLAGADLGNYTLASGDVNAMADIAVRALTVAAVASNKVYDGNTDATVTLSDDRISGDVLTVGHTTALFDTKNVGTAKPVSVTGISLTGADAGNYTLASTTASSSADISAATLTASATVDNKVYDGTTAATIATRSLTGAIAPDDVTLSGGTANFADKNIGVAKSVEVTGLVLAGADLVNYSLASGDVNTAADITAASLVASATVENKVYDGTTVAIISSRSLNGVIGAEDVTVSGGVASFADKYAGNAKSVAVTGLVLGGADQMNYTLASGDVNTAADIIARSLTVSALAQNKVYDGNADATVTLLDNRIGGDVLTIADAVASFDNKNVGTAKPVSVSGISVTGADAGNYALASTTATSSADITAVSLVASATVANKIYDGTTAATIATRSLTGVIGADDVTLTGGTASFADKQVGEAKPVAVAGMTLAGADLANYTLASGDANATADITGRTLTVSATAQNKAYDGNANATVTLSDDGISGDVLTVSHTTALFDDKNVGIAKPVTVTGLSFSGMDAGNYTLASTTANSSADISSRTMTVAATAQNKVYDGNADATVTLSDDRISGDVLTVGHTTASFDNKNVGTAKPVSVAGISITGADAGNYSLANTTAASSADITAVALTASATVANKVYDGTTAATIASRSLTGVIAPDDVTLAGGSASFADKQVGAGKAVSIAGLTLAGADLGNYTLASGDVNATADITARALTVAALASNKVYDGNADASVALSDDRISGDVLTVGHTAAAFDNKNVGTAKPVSVTGITLTGADAGNYALVSTTASSSADITAASLAASATVANKAYDGLMAATIATRSLTGVIAPDDVTLTGGVASFADKYVGSGKAVTITGMTLTGADVLNYALNSGDVNTTADITARALNIVATGVDKVYDATNTATVTLSDDRIGGDTLTLSYTNAEFASINVGTDIVVSVSGLAVAGADAGNYNLAADTAATSADITVRPLTVTAVAQNKVYDGNPDATVTLSDDHIAGEDVTVSFATAAFDTKNVGTAKPVNVAGLSLGGAGAGNYELVATTTATTADITVAALTADATVDNKVYDGTTAAVIASRTLTGVIGADDVTLTGGTANFADKHIGNAKPVAVTGLVLSGVDATNYMLASGDVNTAADIATRPLTVSAAAQNKVYDGNADAMVSLTDNRVLGDALSVSHGAASFDNKNVGTAKPVSVTGISMMGADAANYALVSTTAASSADITAAVLTVSAAAQNKVYDGNTDATVALSDDRISGDVLTVSHTAASFDTKNVGTAKPVSVSGISLTGADAGNYTLASTTASSSADVTVRTLAVLATAQNKAYDGNANATVTLSDNRISGDVLTVGHTTAAFDNKNVGLAKPVTVAGISITGADADNYALANTTAAASADITARSLTITATAQSKVYDGNTNAVATLTDNRVGGDVLTLANTDAGFEDANVGTAKLVNVLGLSISGTDADNYSLANLTATAVADITPVQLTVTADDKSRAYGTANPTFTASIAGFVNGEDNSVIFGSADLTTTAETNSPTGAYPITAALGTLSATNYTFSLVDGNLTITPYALVVSADNQSRTYGAANPALTGSLVGVQNGDNITASYATVADASSGVGNFPITLALVDPDNKLVNYSVTTNEGTLTVSAATLFVTADHQTRAYGVANPALTATITGFVNSENNGVVAGNPALSTTADEASTVGNYPITATLGTLSAANYTFTFVEGALEITAAPLTPSITAASKVYDGSVAATIATRSLTGVVGADEVTLTGGLASFADKNAGTDKAVTATGLGLSGAAANNYVLASTSASATADITPAMLNASASVNDKVYDGTAAATIASSALTGVIAPDEVVLATINAEFTDKNVGAGKDVAIYGMTLGGNDADNYMLSANAINVQANIMHAPVQGAVAVGDKVYDGNANATILTRTLTGVVGEEAVLLEGGAASFADKNVGELKAVAITGLSLNGADAGNYQLASSAVTTAASITARSLAVTAVAQNKIYDGNADATVSLSDDRISGDVLTASHATAAFDNKNVGTAKPVSVSGIIVTGADAGNYTLASVTASSSADITAASLTGSITANSKVYDGTAAATIASRTLAGVIGVDDVTLTGGTATFADKNVGAGKPVTVTGLSLSGADAGNYGLASTSANTTADITGASLIASATVANKVYDGNTTATIATRSLTGVIAPDDVTLTGGTANFVDKNVGADKSVAVTGLTLTGADLANYTLTSGDVNTTADITTASLTGSVTIASKNYDGTVAASIATRSLTGVIGADDVTLSGGAATFNNKNVGTAKPVAVTGLSLSGADLGNYTLASTSANATADIAAIALTVTADDQSRNHGEANPVLTGTLTGVVAGDDITASYSTTATAASPVGTYDIVPTLADPDSNLGNYVVTINNGTLTILGLMPATMGAVTQLPDGNMHLVVSGVPGQVYHLQAIGDITGNNWSNIATNAANGLGVVEFDDLSATNHTSRFYRVSTP